MTDANAAAVAGICARLDGVPLAIELAAARVRIFPPQALLARLHPEGARRLTTLTGGARDRPARQQSLRSTIDWSYQLLDSAEQRLFDRLGVFAGGCSLEAAEAVCGEPDALSDGVVDDGVADGIVSLVDKSLVRPQEGADGSPRFTMLESIREYALERLAASGEAATLRERHARYYMAWLEALMPSLREHRSVVEDRHVAEMSNFALASRWIVGEGDLALGIRWYEAGFRFRSIDSLEHSGRAWRRWHEALITSPEAGPLEARVKALNYIGLFAKYDHALAQAAAILEEGLVLTRTLDDPNELIEVLYRLGDVYRDQDQYARAAALYEEGLALAHARGNQEAIAGGYHTVAELALLEQDYARALTLAQTSLAHSHNLGVIWLTSHATLNAAFAAAHLGESALAMHYFEQDFSVALTYELIGGIVPRLVGLAGLAVSQGRWERAARLLGATEALGGIDSLWSHFQHHEYEWVTTTARAGLDTVAWEAAWAEGRAMTLEQAVAYALAIDEQETHG